MKNPTGTLGSLRPETGLLVLLAAASLLLGCGPSSNFKTALARANAGEPEAQLEVSLMYLRGNGVKQNDTEGANWCKQAAFKGLPAAQRTYGMMLRDGAAVNRNPAQGREWLEKAANQNDVPAQMELAGTLGLFAPPFEFVEAMKWVLIAEKNGATNAPAIKKLIEPQMSATELSQARTKAAEFGKDK